MLRLSFALACVLVSSVAQAESEANIAAQVELSGMKSAETSESELPRTRAERTDYRETSSFDDVGRFIAQLQVAGADFVHARLATSTEGRDIPLIVVASPPVAAPATARRSGKVVVYVQANIHAGEVEGKEVALELLRSLRPGGDARHLLDELILLVVPIYNADGNEAWGAQGENRRGQNGPERVGRRPNGMNLDLNRDCMKAESPEMRGVLAEIYTAWDPDVVIDLHTTNGTRHGYALTYAPPLDPNTPAGVLSLTRDLLSVVRGRLRDRYGMETFDYGNVDDRGQDDDTIARWETFSPQPRFVTNYAGARNRIGVLSEATSYLPFVARAEATRRFLGAVLDVVAERADDVTASTRLADEQVVAWGLEPATAPPLGVRFELSSRGTEPVLLERADAGGGEASGAPQAADIESRPLPVLDRFVATRTSRLPAAWLIPPENPEAIALLRRHGIVVERLIEPWSGDAETFAVRAIDVAQAAFQGHRLQTLEGEFERASVAMPAGSLVVASSQPLALLAFHLLEPESEDGLAAWGLLDRVLAVGRRFPIVKLDDVPKAARVSVE